MSKITADPDHHENQRSNQLDRQLSRNWYLLAGMTVITSLGMAIAVAPGLNTRLAEIWPWANTHLVLLGGLVAAIGLLITHLTVQQRKVTVLRNSVKEMEDESSRKARRNSLRMKALLNISKMMGAVNNPENVFSSITSTCKEIFECEQASLMLLNDSKDMLETRSATGHLNIKDVEKVKQKVGEGFAGWVAQTQQPIILGPDTDLSNYPGLELKFPSVTAAMVVPILLRGELVGVMNVSSRAPGMNYYEEDLQALQVFAENAGTVIRHSEQAEWMRKMIEKQREVKQGEPVG